MALSIFSTDNYASIIRPQDIFAEVESILTLIAPCFDFSLITTVYQDIVRLFTGKYQGYQKCNTGYHDLPHTEDCLLEMVRLIHGAHVNNFACEERSIHLGVISALVHDSGYIQTEAERAGTGAKYTLTHIERSIAFMEQYFARQAYSPADFQFCEACLKCTGLNVKIDGVRFESAENELMGKILGTADLLGQMSNLNYLEKLPVLFQEFREGGVPGYRTELELLEKTPKFWEFTQRRLATDLGDMRRFMRDHFRLRWGIDRDLTTEAIEGYMYYLKYIIENHPSDYRRYLRRQVMLRILDELEEGKKKEKARATR
jgi:hypothetical protein